MRTYFWKKYRIKKTGEALSILNTRTPFWKPFLLMLPSLIALFFMVVIPFIFVIIGSFRARVHFTTYGWSISHYWNQSGTVGILNDPKFHIALVNSLVYAVTALPIGLMISILISTAITMVVRKYAQNFWQTVFFLPYMTGAVAVSLTFTAIFGRANEGAILPLLYNSSSRWNPFIVILIRGVWGGLAFQVLILTTAMLSVNPDLYKSSAIDGASTSKQFFMITLPSIQRTLSFLFTIGIINGIKVFPLALYNNNATDAIAENGSSLLIYIFQAVRFSSGDFGRAMASSVFLFVLGVTLSFTLRKTVSLIYQAKIKLGERNVINKLKAEIQTRKISFKI
ncbi:carbohydrate ABC transporter permease [Metamycoplasma auris]|uniref:Carbohydrate ABC transporter membrane protein 1 (CUT1 family) n=1 Tax=Metamycoplasma auris TaxID=51363 RepID=A0A2W7FZQ1_9BACT|nr:sugar ABC transporter permease [Metamycoplasma auris]PZV99889.1 carbohydrate ABC transporter membrane protein 1 (CUT1 family) [Metamycoplasma auris]